MSVGCEPWRLPCVILPTHSLGWSARGEKVSQLQDSKNWITCTLLISQVRGPCCTQLIHRASQRLSLEVALSDCASTAVSRSGNQSTQCSALFGGWTRESTRTILVPRLLVIHTASVPGRLRESQRPTRPCSKGIRAWENDWMEPAFGTFGRSGKTMTEVKAKTATLSLIRGTCELLVRRPSPRSCMRLKSLTWRSLCSVAARGA